MNFTRLFSYFYAILCVPLLSASQEVKEKEPLPTPYIGQGQPSLVEQLSGNKSMQDVFGVLVQMQGRLTNLEGLVQKFSAYMELLEQQNLLILDKVNAIQHEKFSIKGQRAKDSFTLAINAVQKNPTAALDNFFKVLSHQGYALENIKQIDKAKKYILINQEDAPDALVGSVFYIAELLFKDGVASRNEADKAEKSENQKRIRELANNKLEEAKNYFEFLIKVRTSVSADAKKNGDELFEEAKCYVRIPNDHYYLMAHYYLGKVRYDLGKQQRKNKDALQDAVECFDFVIKSLRGVIIKDETKLDLYRMANYYVGRIHRSHEPAKAMEYFKIARDPLGAHKSFDEVPNEEISYRAQYYLGELAYTTQSQKEVVAYLDPLRRAMSDDDHHSEKIKKCYMRSLYYLCDALNKGEKVFDKVMAVQFLNQVIKHVRPQDIYSYRAKAVLLLKEFNEEEYERITAELERQIVPKK